MDRRWIYLVGRSLLAMLFVLAGLAKLTNAAPFIEHMQRFHIPTSLLPLVIILELGAGAALLFGLFSRQAAAALGLFCIATALIFHSDLSEKAERTSFLKDLAIAGGLIALSASRPAPRYVEDPL